MLFRGNHSVDPEHRDITTDMTLLGKLLLVLANYEQHIIRMNRVLSSNDRLPHSTSSLLISSFQNTIATAPNDAGKYRWYIDGNGNFCRGKAIDTKPDRWDQSKAIGALRKVIRGRADAWVDIPAAQMVDFFVSFIPNEKTLDKADRDLYGNGLVCHIEQSPVVCLTHITKFLDIVPIVDGAFGVGGKGKKQPSGG